jgi:hypothetical protein
LTLYTGDPLSLPMNVPHTRSFCTSNNSLLYMIREINQTVDVGVQSV